MVRRLLSDRVHAMGLMPTSMGPWWGGLKEDATPPSVVDSTKGGSSSSPSRHTPALAGPAGFQARIPDCADGDGTLRILGPLDPLIWDRWLVQRLFDFEYVWSYTNRPPSAAGAVRVPLLLGGQLVGRSRDVATPRASMCAACGPAMASIARRSTGHSRTTPDGCVSGAVS